MNENYMLIIPVTRKRVPAGSVIIEGKKCGIVTTDTYNDWLVIGYTPIKLFSPER